MTDRRIDAATKFLEENGWGDAARTSLAGDASDRRYERLFRGSKTAVLMDAPPGTGDDPKDFIHIADHLRSVGLSPPMILAKDLDNGFLLLEDLGDDLFARVVEKDPSAEKSLYLAATDVLLELQSHPAPKGIPDLSADDWAEAAAFALDWYRFAATGLKPEETTRSRFLHSLSQLLRQYADGPRVLILRDYHAENLLYLPHRPGVRSVGLLDFQLGQMGQPAYDLVSLIQDARRDVSQTVADQCIRHFSAISQTDEMALRTSIAVIGVQRALRIMGIFARLCLARGKSDYPHMLPRVWGQLQQNLTHPALADFRILCNDLLPAPTTVVLERIRSQCATISP